MRVPQSNAQLITIMGKTDEKLVNQKMRMLEERFKSVFENVNDCIVYLDLTGRILDVNRRGLELIGGSKKDFIGKHFVEFWTADLKDKSHVMNMLKKMLAGERLNFKTGFKNKKDQNIEFEVSASNIKFDGKDMGILVIARDITERKKAEEEVRDLTEKYRSLIENAQDVIGTFDLKGNIITINKAVEEYGFKIDDVVGKNMLKFVSKKYWPRLLADLVKVARGKSTKAELEIVTPIGKRIAEYQKNPIMKGSKVVGIQTVLRDITERKKMEEELTESEEQYRVLFEQSPVGIGMATLEGNIINVNKAMEVITGYSQKELQNLMLFNICENLENTKTILETLNRQGVIKGFQTRVKRKDGTIIKVLLDASKIHIRGDDFLQIRLQDLSELVLAEEKLRDSEEKYRNLFENAGDVIVTFDTKGKITSVNKAILNYGFGKEEIIGENFLKFISKSNLQNILKDFVKTTRGEPVEGQVELITPKGKIFAEYRTSPIKNKDKIVGTQAILRNITERRMMEDEIRASEEKYRGLFEEAMDAILVADAETGILMDCNRAACELVGREKSEIIGQHQRILHPPSDIDGKFSKTFKRHLIEKGGQILETKVITKEGKLKDVAIKANVFELGGKKVMQGIFRDITEQKRIEEELIQERDFLQALMDNIPDTIYFKDVNSKFTRINKAQTMVLGLNDPKEAEGKTDFDFFTSEHAQDAFNDEQEIIKTGKPIISKVEKVRRADGQFRWFTATKMPIKDPSGRINGLVGISRDITESKQIEEKMEYQKSLFDALMDYMPDPIYFKDMESRFIRVSRISCPGLGIQNPEEAAGMSDFDFAPREVAEQTYADDQMVMKTGQPVIGKEEVMVSKIGKTWYSATKVPIRNKDGKVIGLVGISRDITKIKETEDELRRYSMHLEEIVEERTRKLREAQRLATIGETAAMVGHDLRNPLQSIAAIPYLVKQTVQLMPNQVKETVNKSSLPVLMEMLQDQTLYMNKIVSDLQDYARPVKLELKETNLYNVISEILSTILIAENIEVLNEIARDFFATLDPYLLKRVFTNLITNAVQAMPEGGKLTIEAHKDDDEVALSVQDTGVGIPEENMSKLFQPLFTTKAKGQGLGLAVCKRIVEAHGGKITVTSKVRYGSTFTVHIPLKREVKQNE